MKPNIIITESSFCGDGEEDFDISKIASFCCSRI